MITSVNGIHKVAVSPHLGEGRHDAFKNVDVASADIFYEMGLEPGDFFEYEGKIYQVARAMGGALAQGDLVRRSYGGALRAGTVEAAPAPTKAVLKVSFNLVAGELVVVSRRLRSLLWINSGTGIGQVRQIKQNTGSTDTNPNLVYVAEPYEAQSFIPSGTAVDSPDAFTTTPAAADGAQLIVPWEVEKSAAITDFVHGVALGTVTQGNYTVLGIAGPFLAKMAGNVDALELRGVAVPSAAAGVGKGKTAAGLTAVEASVVFGYNYAAFNGAAALRLVEFFGNFAR